MRTKSGKTGKLSTDYKWSKDMRECFAKEGKNNENTTTLYIYNSTQS